MVKLLKTSAPIRYLSALPIQAQKDDPVLFTVCKRLKQKQRPQS